MTSRREVVDDFGRRKQRDRQVLGWSMDDEKATVTFFVPEHEDIGVFPSDIAGYVVELSPLPRPRSLGEAI